MAIDNDWRGKAYAFYSHKACEDFPCHETGDETNFNCLFCYCPLYMLGRDCGGDFTFSRSGVKVCASCAVPHDRESYGYIVSRFQDIRKKLENEAEKAAETLREC